MKLIGIDGCADGWLAAISDERLQAVEFSVLPRLDHLFERAAVDDVLVVIDIPIGLADNGPRVCDIEARRLLGRPRGSSVFPAPNRRTLAASNYEEACRLNRAVSGTALSKQAFAILPKIREVDGLISPGLQTVIREAHPEVTFAALAGLGRGLAFPKKSTASNRRGEDERLHVLAGYIGRFDPGSVRSSPRPARTQRDDVVDAAACLVTAYRVSRGEHLRLPAGDPPIDAHGLRMEIVA